MMKDEEEGEEEEEERREMFVGNLDRPQFVPLDVIVFVKHFHIFAILTITRTDYYITCFCHIGEGFLRVK